jgi:HPt (histidine-containing phosphotransfer) domain-containing protein
MSSPLRSTFADDPTMADLLEIYGTALGVHVHKLRTHIAKNDAEEIRRELHQLKGSGKSFGYPAITEKAAAVEAGLRAGSAVMAARRELEGLIGLLESVEHYRAV